MSAVPRERRQGIDRVHDDPERQLIKEVEVMEGVLEMLCRSRQQAKEQVGTAVKSPVGITSMSMTDVKPSISFLISS